MGGTGLTRLLLCITERYDIEARRGRSFELADRHFEASHSLCRRGHSRIPAMAYRAYVSRAHRELIHGGD
jgi:hypothetical protein